MRILYYEWVKTRQLYFGSLLTVLLLTILLQIVAQHDEDSLQAAVWLLEIVLPLVLAVIALRLLTMDSVKGTHEIFHSYSGGYTRIVFYKTCLLVLCNTLMCIVILAVFQLGVVHCLRLVWAFWTRLTFLVACGLLLAYWVGHYISGYVAILTVWSINLLLLGKYPFKPLFLFSLSFPAVKNSPMLLFLSGSIAYLLVVCLNCRSKVF